MLRLQARDEPPGSPLLRMVGALPATGYRSLGPEERRTWLRRARKTVEIARAEGTGRGRAKPTRRRTPARKTQARRTTSKAQRRAPAVPIPPGPEALGIPIAQAGTKLGRAHITRLEKLGVLTIADALRHYPYRHHDFSRTVPISQLRIGHEQTIRGTVDRARAIRMGRGGRMQSTEATISDDSGARIRVVWFNQPYLAKQLPPGTEIAIAGGVRAYRGRPTFDNPAYERITDDLRHTGRLVPVYHLTQGLPQRALREAIADLLERFADRLPEPLPAVVDEQHRFGVMQRAALRGVSDDDEEEPVEALEAPRQTPHLLVMTATPIPRSLALTLYGDLDISTIDEMPPGRTPIETRWLTPIERPAAFEHVRAEVAAGRQAFVICPLVEGSDAVVSRAATEEYERLRSEQFPELADRIALLHGRMSGRDKDAVMQRFASGEASVLVSTAVVEVGIDVPNATVMVIEGADRFGMSQLHQFRGRVGRGEHASTCFLLADDPSPEAEERLSLVARTSNGFELAQADLELRGPGELFGTRQSGLPSLRVASLLDGRLIEATRHEAETMLDADPELASSDLGALRQLVERAEAGIVAEAH